MAQIIINSILYANDKVTVTVTGTSGQQGFEIPQAGILAYAQGGVPTLNDEMVLQLALIQMSQMDPSFTTLDQLVGKTLTALPAAVSVS